MAAVLLLAAVLISLAVTLLVRFYARHHLLDIPNHRSSHQLPTPRGGGLGIVVAFYAVLLFLFFTGRIESPWFYALLASLLVAGIGFWDDHQSLAARWRLLVHLGAAMLAVFFLGGQLTTQFSGLMTLLLSVFFLVWSLNLFNFMDGIDGIASSEAVFVSVVLGGLMWFINSDLALVALVLAASSMGFLILNWPTAKIFMGDIGSGFLGFVIALLILIYSQVSTVFLPIGLIVFSVFIVDATMTLITRFLRGEKWYQAHCSHAYQHAARQYGHLKVLLMVWVINLFWLLPIAIWIFLNPGYGLVGSLIAYLPLIFLAHHFKAGRDWR